MQHPIWYLEDFSDLNSHVLYNGVQESLENADESEWINEFYGFTDSMLLQIAQKRWEEELYKIYSEDEEISDNFELACFKIYKDVREQLLECRDTANKYLKKWAVRKVPQNRVFDFLNVTVTDIWTFIETDVNEIIKWACNNICLTVHFTLDYCSHQKQKKSRM